MAAAPPLATPTARRLIAVLDRLSTLRRRHAFAIVVGGYAAALLLDLATGRDINVVAAYGVLACFAAWTLGERAGLVTVAAICGGMIALPHLHMIVGEPGPADLTRLLGNSVSRSAVLALLAVSVSTLRCLLALERWRADTDALTGALNKGAFTRRMADAVQRAQRSGRAMMLAYMDLDGFKAVNDRHGHAAGDRVLQAFAAGVAEAIRRDDLFARIGGDEFVVLMAAPDEVRGDAAARLRHARLRGVLAATGLPVTCSMGALLAPAARIAPGDAMLGLADGLMYEVKRAGKDALRLAAVAPDGTLLRTALAPAEPVPSFDALLHHLDRMEARQAA